MKNSEPSPNGPQTDQASGRDQRGRFAKGNSGGPGNPLAADVGRYRARLFRAVKVADVDQAVKTIRQVMSKGKDSDRLAAAKLLLDRVLGPIVELDLIARIETLEAAQRGRQ